MPLKGDPKTVPSIAEKPNLKDNPSHPDCGGPLRAEAAHSQAPGQMQITPQSRGASPKTSTCSCATYLYNSAAQSKPYCQLRTKADNTLGCVHLHPQSIKDRCQGATDLHFGERMLLFSG